MESNEPEQIFIDGYLCPFCGKDISDFAKERVLTGCPYCQKSYCE